jgi:hypothetical protein
MNCGIKAGIVSIYEAESKGFTDQKYFADGEALFGKDA